MHDQVLYWFRQLVLLSNQSDSVLQIHKFKPMHSPAVLRGKRSFVSYVPPPTSECEVAALQMNEYFLKRPVSPPSSDMEGPVAEHLDLKDASYDFAQPPVEASDDLSDDEEKTPISFCEKELSQLDPEEFNQCDDSKTEICNPHDGKTSRASTNVLQPKTLNNVIAKSNRRPTGNAWALPFILLSNL